MIGLLCFVLAVLALPFKSKLRLEAENAAPRHQLIVLRRKLQRRVRLTNQDRWLFYPAVWLASIDPEVVTIIRPETLVRWHRVGFRCYWRWKSRRARHPGKRKLPKDIMGQRMPADQRRLVPKSHGDVRGSCPHR
jgi:hypothetical protein